MKLLCLRCLRYLIALMLLCVLPVSAQTNSELRTELLARKAADPAFAQMLANGDMTGAAMAFSAGRIKVVHRQITERGVIEALGPVAGEQFLAALDTFVNSTLPAGHPLLPYFGAIKRCHKFLTTDGLDIGAPTTRSLMDALVAVGVIDANASALIKKQAEVPDPVDANQITEALRDD